MSEVLKVDVVWLTFEFFFGGRVGELAPLELQCPLGIATLQHFPIVSVKLRALLNFSSGVLMYALGSMPWNGRYKRHSLGLFVCMRHLCLMRVADKTLWGISGWELNIDTSMLLLCYTDWKFTLLLQELLEGEGLGVCFWLNLCYVEGQHCRELDESSVLLQVGYLSWPCSFHPVTALRWWFWSQL